jgi:hypothetical protein
MMSEKLKSVVAEYIKENPFCRMSENEVRTLIDAKLQDSAFGNYLKDSPRFYKTILDLIRDPDAIPAFLSIINKGKELKQFSFCMIIIFIISFIYTAFFLSGGVFIKIIKKVGFSFFVLCLDIGVFYYFFSEQVRPGLNIIFKHFHL